MNHSHGEDEKKTARSYPIRAHLYSTLRLSVRPTGQSENSPQIGQVVQFLSKHGKNIHTPPKGEVCIFVQLVRGVPLIPPAKPPKLPTSQGKKIALVMPGRFSKKASRSFSLFAVQNLPCFHLCQKPGDWFFFINPEFHFFDFPPLFDSLKRYG